MTRDLPIEKRLIGNSALHSANGEVVGVDAEGLVRRLILFDSYVLNSVRLQEFPLLATSLGYEGLRDLLSSKMIEIRCECLQMAQVGQAALFGDPVLPLFTYKFNWLDANDKVKYVHDCLQGMHGVPELGHKNAIRLKKLIADAIVPLPSNTREQLGRESLSELRNENLLRESIRMAVAKRFGTTEIACTLKIHQLDEDVFKVETNLALLSGLSDQDAHKLVESGLLAITGLMQVLGEMRTYNALSGFRDEELPLFRAKLGYLANALSTQEKEQQFQRVIELKDMPSIITTSNSFDVERLLKVRDSNETREFRDWIASCGGADDKEIKDQVAGFRAQAGLRVGSIAGKAIRFLLTNGVGFFGGSEGALLSLSLSTLDQFVVDRLLPRTGIAAFVNELYPSIFERDTRIG